MAPPKASKSSNSADNPINTIKSNWRIRSVDNCIPRGLWPNKRFEEWGDDIITLLSQISSLPGATVPDFRARLNKVIRTRQEKTRSVAGKQGWTKTVDLRAVLREFEREAEERKAEEARSASNANGINGGHTTRIQVPKTPMNHDDEDEEEEEEGSSEPLAGGKYQYLNGVRPVKVNLNPDASAAKKPTRPKPPPRGKRRKADDDTIPGPPTLEFPSLVHQDPDPRVPDDTGFLSDLEGEATREKARKRKKRLSRLEQHRIREPHWQIDNHNIVVDVLAPARRLGILLVEDGEEAAPVLDEEPEEDIPMEDSEDIGMDNAEDSTLDTEFDVPMDDSEATIIEIIKSMKSLPELPANATVTERRELEELRLSMEQRIWRIKVLSIEERALREKRAGMEENGGDAEEDVGTGGRVLRKRRGK